MNKDQEPKAVRILKKIQAQVGGDLRFSKKGVPHLVINEFYSVCYFAKYRSITVFDNYGNFDVKQNKTYFKQWLDAALYLGLVINQNDFSTSTLAVEGV